MILTDQLSHLACIADLSTKKLLNKLKNKAPRDLDTIVHNLHNSAFEKIDCLQCANCCKSISPILNKTDVDRLSSATGMKTADFTARYIAVDEDGDMVFKTHPCPFLLPDNKCTYYEKRPKACREYPHTDQSQIHKILNLCLKNTYYCPAVYIIFEELKKHYRK